MSANYRNRNRGYQGLRVWCDAQDYYAATCRVFRAFPYELKRVASQQIASADSVHRNIAEAIADGRDGSTSTFSTMRLAPSVNRFPACISECRADFRSGL